MKDYSRKAYNDFQYRDWLRNRPAKSVWNSILERSVGYNEYTSKSKSSLAASVVAYLKQSETKKPYHDRGFVEMEDMWEGPPGGFSGGLPSFDHPWTMSNPIDPDDEPWGSITIFDLNSTSTFCPGETRPFEMYGTHPIYSLTISNHEPGTTIAVTGGYGTNTVTGTITAAADEAGNVNFTGYMTSFEGISGSSNYLMYENCCVDVDCDAFENDEGVSPTTMAQDDSATIGVTGGHEPYTWTLTQGDGSGFTIDASTTDTTTIYTDESACGSADIQVTDSCGCVATFNVRCTTGTWVHEGTGPQYCAGCGGPVYCDDSRGSGWSPIPNIPSKNCYPPSCKYYFRETIRQYSSWADSDAVLATCEAERASRFCTGNECSGYGAGGMQCGECVGHPPTWLADCVGIEPVVVQAGSADYKSNQCAFAVGKYFYCGRCVPSVSLQRHKWTCV